MEKGLLHLHSILRWVILILLLASIYTTYIATNLKHKKIWLYTLIACHTTLLIGLYQTYNYYQRITTDVPLGMKDIMKNKLYRFYIIEHPIMMVLGILLVTIAYSSTKRAKYKRASVLFIIALIIIVAAVPWPFRGIQEGIARPWLPGMGG